MRIYWTLPVRRMGRRGARTRDSPAPPDLEAAVDAARIASEAGVGRLLLSHFSARYSDIDMLIEEARSDFHDTEAAVELQRYALQRIATEEADQ